MTEARTAPNPQEIGTVLALVNTHSTHALEAVPALVDIARKFYIPRLVFMSDDPKVTEERIDGFLDDHPETTSIVGCGGDQAALTAVMTAFKRPDRGLKAAVIPTGNGNDFATMVNGPGSVAQPGESVKYGEVHEIAPLICETQIGNKRQAHFALSYIGIGATGYASHLLNHPRLRHMPGYRYKRLRPIFDYSIVGLTMARAKPFDLIEAGENRSRAQLDLTFMNGPRMGKHQLVSEDVPHDLHLPGIYKTEVRNKRAQDIAGWISGVLHENMPGVMLKQPYECTVAPRANHPLFMQFDGDPIPIQAETQIRIWRARHTVPVVSPMLADKLVV